MIYKTFKKMFLGIAVLASLSAGAQEFDSELQLSTDIIYWYRICSAAPGMEDLAMTDYNGMIDTNDYFPTVFMMATETEDYHSQWMLTAGEDGKVVITNRATGSQISGVSVNTEFETGYYNVTQLSLQATPGFTVTALGDNAFKLESVEDDGINRCLALADVDTGFPVYPETGESTSIIGWKFFPVEIEDAIGSMSASRSSIKIMNKRVVVTGCTDWQLFNALGEEMPRTVSLPTGVYMVKTPKRTVKILVP